MADVDPRRVSRRRALRLAAGGAAALLVACSGDNDDAASSDDRSPAPTPSETERATTAIVRQVDHILLRVDDAAAAFATLTDTLQIPVAWPLFEYRGFHSGAAGFGNVNLEVLQHADGEVPPFATAPGIYLIGAAFEPVTVDGAITQLDARGIEHSSPFDDGLNETIAWTSVDLEPTPDTPIRLLVKYKFDQDARRAMLGSQLRERNGGPLGVRMLSEIEIGARDLTRATDEWQRLFDPIEPVQPAYWELGDGPAIRLIEALDDRMQRLLITVDSLPAAVSVLRERELLAGEGEGWAEIAGFDGAMRLIQDGV
jgi:hypothetical protein